MLGVQNWEPTKAEMRAISAEMVKLAAQDLCIERLEVDLDLATEMFKDLRYKSEQIPSIAQQHQNRVTLYRLGDHIDISRGPMVASTRFLGKCTVLAAHKLANEGASDAFYRVQGVALPAGFALNHFAYGLLEQRAQKLVSLISCENRLLTLSNRLFITLCRTPLVCPMNPLRNSDKCNYLKMKTQHIYSQEVL